MNMVAFVGGPFDGHVQPVRILPSDLRRIAILPISRCVLLSLHGKPMQQHAPVTSFAEYRLVETDQGCCYRFVCAHHPVAKSSN
jgi:hypothetical protein